MNALGCSPRRPLFSTALASACLLAIAASVCETAYGQRYRPPPRPPQLEGNWIKQKTVPNPNYGKPLPGTNPYQREYDMRETINKNRVDGDAVLRDIGRSLRYDIESWNYRNQQRPQGQTSRPQYIPSQPQTVPSQSGVVERIVPSPTTIVEPAAPARNVIPAAAPKPNDDFSQAVSRAVRENGSTRTDAGQVLVARDAAARINDSVDTVIEMSGNDAMKQAWKNAVADGSVGSLETFRESFGEALKALDPVAAKRLDLSVKLGSLAANLEDGLLTNEGKQKALEDLMNDVAALPANDPSRAALVDDLKQMRQLQQIGELMDLAALDPQPLVPIWHGLDAAGIPHETFADFLGLPVMSGPAESDTSSVGDATIRLVNPDNTGSEVRFSVGGKSEKMQPGSELGLSGTASVIFDPGNGQYRGVSVTSGTWQWHRDDGLWSLRRIQPQITLENPGFDGVFHYTVNGRHASLKKGESATHADPLPLTIAFDRGDGEAPIRKVLAEGVYVVAIDAASKWLDLFRTDDVQAEDSAASPTTGAPPVARGEQVKKSLADPQQRQRMNDLIESLRSSREPRP